MPTRSGKRVAGGGGGVEAVDDRGAGDAKRRRSAAQAGASAPAPEAPATPAVADEGPAPVNGLTPYELEREERIRQNRMKMAALNIPARVATMEDAATAAKTPSSRGIAGTARKKQPKEVLPRRASLRIKGAPADPALAAGVDVESRGGRVTLNAPLVGYDEASIAAAKAARDAATAEAARLAEERAQASRVA